MTEIRSNNPPPELATGEMPPATFILTRATGEIEIRGHKPEYLTYEQASRPEYELGHHVQIGEIWAVTGRKIA